MKKYFDTIFLVIVFITMVLFSTKGRDAIKSVMNHSKSRPEKLVVLIDAGHGGRDPGKIGVNNVLEKDINLAIAMKLKSFLELNDIEVVMTRTEDMGHYSESDSNKKMADLRKRISMMDESNPIIAVSIHQNSFEQKKYKGAQVFYHSKSTEGKALAEIVQAQIKETVKDDNTRKAKANSDYYLLKKSSCPLIIVECGFLSNDQEAELLANEVYQEKMAWAIHLGIMRHISGIVE
ncbi:N-acetylmuramoyl-L-alanine amidase [Mobilisporobacter senegalensis]|uniref:N-acetylmuramoyl-L-alanine amidase n=1 Tax=Mobilisporobacter senegalensis TaxID=1329262 RepID=A0A3N1XKX2_9FIRM|nr:N-acetylmuramoyl-L-alanine amidase [Mobilisporobacter senegalensis]ROR25702.1 N-acetylmuramoyl-L-alanine amidase [Mobilisporobacter senegalensis]